jgi:aryl-alcohol dehydrogenase-like predicted oxidoreductase
MYSQGSSEEILGRALKDFADRDAVVIATKLRHPMRPGPNGSGLSRKAVFTEIDHSLRRLGTDYVDLYQIHRMDPATPIEETLEALHDVVKAGKVRYLGASSMHAWELSKVLHLQREHGWARFVSMQDHYNLLAREEEREMLPLCADEGVGTIPWSPLARGRLTREWNASTDRSGTDPFADMLYTQESSDRAIIEAVGKIAEARGVTRAQVSLAWLRRNPVVVAPLVGARRGSASPPPAPDRGQPPGPAIPVGWVRACPSSQATANLMPGQPAAPSGMGGAGVAVWVAPVESVARHWM